MRLVVNGKEINFTKDLTITELFGEQKVKMPEMVSVELNGEILKRSGFERTVLKEGDNAEFLYFMGGGSGTK